MAITVKNSSNLSFNNVRVTAGLNPYRTHDLLTKGVDARDSQNVNFVDCLFERLGSAFIVGGMDGLTVSQSLFRENLLDNMNIGSNMSNVLISDNQFFSQVAKVYPTFHYDNIQLWVHTNATQNSRNITITKNQIYDLSGQVSAQAIFGRGDYADSNGVQNPFGFENLIITDNLIVTQHANAISITDAKGLRIQNNTLVYGGDHRKDIESVFIPGIAATLSTDVIIENNITPMKRGYPTSDTADFRNNSLYQVATGEAAEFLVNPFKPNPTRQDFGTIDHAMTRNADGSRRGAQIDLRHADHPTAAFSYSRELRDGQFVYTFDASQSLPAIGKDLQDAQYQWRFADGSQATGVVVEKTFDQAGEQNITLVVTDRFGQQHTLVKERVIIRDSNAVAASFDQNLVDGTSTRTTLAPTGKTSFVQRSASNRAILLGESQGHLYIEPTDPDLSESTSTRQMTIAASIQAKANENSSQLPLAARHGVWGVHLQADGTVRVSMGGQRYSFKPDTQLMDGKWHEVAMTVTEGSFQFYINGAKVYSTAITAAQSTAFFQEGGYGIGIGGSGPWASNRAGTRFQLDNLFIGTAALTDAQIAAMALRNTLV